jgi:hypothetical protein
MNFYCTKEADGSIHVQNAVMGHLGQHHVHTLEDFEQWGKGVDLAHIVMLKDCAPCSCGLKAGEVKDG